MPGMDLYAVRALAGFGLMVIVLMLISSVCVWPYLWSGAKGVGERAEACRNLLWIGGGSLGLCACVSLAMSWLSERYSVVKNLLCTLIISLLVNLVMMIVLRVNLLGSDLGLSGGILTIVLHGILGVMLSLVPGVLGMLPGWLLQSILYFYFNVVKG